MTDGPRNTDELLTLCQEAQAAGLRSRQQLLAEREAANDARMPALIEDLLVAFNTSGKNGNRQVVVGRDTCGDKATWHADHRLQPYPYVIAKGLDIDHVQKRLREAGFSVTDYGKGMVKVLLVGV